MPQHSKFTPWLNWGITSFFVLFQFMLQTDAGIMAHAWQKDFNINALAVANLSAAFFYIYVLMQIPVGLIYDRFNAKYILTFAGVALALGCFLFAGTHNYDIAFFSRMIMGVGAAFGFVGLLYISSIWFSSRSFPLVVSLAETLGMLTIASAEVLLAWLVIYLGWRQTMFYAGILAAGIALLSFVFVKEKPKVKPQSPNSQTRQSSWKSLWHLCRSKQIWLVGLFGFFTFAIVNVFTSLWGVPFLTHVYGIQLHLAARIVSMVFLGIAIGTLFNSWLSIKLNRSRPIMAVNSFITALALGFIILVPHLPITVLYLLFFIAGFSSACYILSYTLIKESMPLAYRAAALATVNMMLMASAPILQPFDGLLISNHIFGFVHSNIEVYRTALATLPLGFLIASVLVFFMQESVSREDNLS